MKAGGGGPLQLPLASCRQVGVTQSKIMPSSCLRSGSGGETHLAGDYILIRGAGRGPAPGSALLLVVSVGRCQIWAQQPVGISWSAAGVSPEGWGPGPPGMS